MKISVEWLREYIRLRESPEQLRDDLTLAGLIVDAVEDHGGDTVLELEVTSNRPDCLSHVGVARELAALYRRRLVPPPDDGAVIASEGDRVDFGIEIRDPDLCPRYTGLVLDGVRVGPSPRWMARRLEAAGMRPVNNIVDVTNYVLLELGHPLHAFDFERLRGGRIVVARARPGQTMATLDGVERRLDADMLLINDGEGPVAVAGVMGGLESEISPDTRVVLLECAYFARESVRRTAKKLGLSTEASYRFERGVDWDDTVRATARAGRLIADLAGGRVAGSLQDVYPVPLARPVIPLDRRRAEKLLGVALGDRFVRSTLERLGFRLEADGRGRWRVTAPSHRADIELEADLVEELARFYGYHRIPATQPATRGAGVPSAIGRVEQAARRLLQGLGYHEGINLSFADAAEHGRFAPPGGGNRVEVTNPLTDETGFLRTTLAGGLVRAVRHNFNHGTRVVRLFELGKVYRLDAAGPRERAALGVAATGDFAGRNWSHPGEEYGFFHLKGALGAMLGGLRSAPWEVAGEAGVAWLDPASAAALVIGGDPVGVLGRLHPALEEDLKLRQRLYLAEIDFEALSRHLGRPTVAQPLPRYPAVERDLSVVVAAEVAYATVREGIMALGIVELAGLELIDVYEGAAIPAGKRGMTLRLTFQDRLRTLTVDQVQGFSDNVVTFLRDGFGAELR